MTTSILAFNESLQHAARWSTRTVTVSGTGSTTGALPATNVFTPNPAQVFERTGITSGGAVTLDLQLVVNTAPFPPLQNFAMAWGFLNVVAIEESSGRAFDLTVTLSESTSAFAGPYDYTATRTVGLQEAYGPAVRQVWVQRDGLTSEPAQRLAGTQPRQFNRITFTASPGSNWTLRVGRLALMAGFVCRIEPTPQRSARDRTEIVRSFSGYPYALTGARTRTFSGTILGITDRQIYGDFRSGQSLFASIHNINALSGVGAEVCIIERAGRVATSSEWQQQPVFGLLASPIVAQRIASTQDDAGTSQAAIEVEQIPLG